MPQAPIRTLQSANCLVRQVHVGRTKATGRLQRVLKANRGVPPIEHDRGIWQRLALQALVTESQKHVTGSVRVKLYKGNIITAGRQSPLSLYNPHIATMEADPTKAYNQDDATGFIRLNALRLKVAARVQGGRK